MKWLARNFGSLRHVWLVASDWCDLLNEKYLSRHGIASVKTPRTFTSWMNKDSSFGGIMVLNKTSEGNDAGWYLNEFNPSGTGGTKKRYYCFGEPNKPLPEEFRPGPRGFTFSTRAEVNNSIEQDALACDDDDETREGALQLFLRQADDLAAKGELTGQGMTEYVNDVLVEYTLRKNNEGLAECEKITRVPFLKKFGLLMERHAKAHSDEFGEEEEFEGQEEEEDEELVSDSQAPYSENISEQTVVRWLNILGLSYNETRKDYYNDTHEHPSTIKYSERLIERYLHRRLRPI